MKVSKSIVFGMGLAVALTACKKDQPQQQQTSALDVESTRDMTVPSNFNYQTDKDVYYSFSLDQAPLNGKYKMEIYDNVPAASSGVLASAFIGGGSTYSGEMKVAAGVDQFYVVIYAPDGSSFLTVLPLNGNSVSHTFYQGKKSTQSMHSGPDCNSGCDQTKNNPSGWWDASSGDVYCVTGTYNGGGLNVKNGSDVRLCGTGNFNSISIDNGTLELSSGADVTVANLSLNSGRSNKLIVNVGATLTLTNWFTPNSDVENYGTMLVSGFNLNSNADFTNNGTFTLSGTNYSSLDGDLENNGTMVFKSNLTVNSNSKVENNCSITVEKTLMLNGEIKNKSYITVGGKTTINSNGKLELKDGAMASLEDVWLDGKIEGKGSTSLVKASGNSGANSNGEVKGNLEYCDANGIENFPNGTFKGGASASCNVYIPTSICNGEGHGTPQISDADNDGVADKLDAYPNDGSRAANSFYPSEGTFGTLGFEDLWPSYGDYDFNDLIVDYRYQNVLNADNKVVDLKAKFVTRAIGGSFKNGFGFQLDLASGAVNSVNGTVYSEGIITTAANGTESGQTKATILVYDNAYNILQNAGGSFVNTTPGNPYVSPDTLEVTVLFGSAQDPSAFGTAPYNPFIFVDQTRGREVHLAGQQPTDLADANYFGTNQDNTNPNGANTYKSAENLPWAINVVSGFDYPEEKVDIVKAYTLFDNWAQSGGLSNTDWYEDNAGYRAEENIFQAP